MKTQKNLIPLLHASLRVARHTNQPGPKPRRLYEGALTGSFPATFEGGRWYVDEADIPKVAEALGIEVRHPVAA